MHKSAAISEESYCHEGAGTVNTIAVEQVVAPALPSSDILNLTIPCGREWAVLSGNHVHDITLSKEWASRTPSVEGGITSWRDPPPFCIDKNSKWNSKGLILQFE